MFVISCQYDLIQVLFLPLSPIVRTGNVFVLRFITQRLLGGHYCRSMKLLARYQDVLRYLKLKDFIFVSVV